MNTTNSMTLSSNERRKIECVLQNFLTGASTLTDVQAALQNYVKINYDLAPNYREMHDNQLQTVVQIRVIDQYVQHMLNKYIVGEISALELSNWAAFIFTSGGFVPNGETEDEQWKAGEGPLWDILQQLMTPSVFGELTPEIAQRYLAQLM